MNYNLEFLNKLYNQKNLCKYARITLLTLDEYPIEVVEGRITAGSINVDGASALRRTCNLTFTTQEPITQEWALNSKFKLEVGLENYVDSYYPEVIWFKQGIFLLTSFNSSQSTNNFTISLSGKDKMSLLNGEISGSLEASIDFGTIEEEDQNGNWVIRKIPLEEIIRNAVHIYAHEPLHKIIIKDLEPYGLELLEYRFDEPLYLIRNKNDPNYFNAYFDLQVESDKKLSDYNDSDFEILLENDLESDRGNFTIDSKEYKIAKIAFGDCAGYRLTDLVYAGDLIANIGESLTSVLDKIRNMLVEFEYFYDVDGFFVFQKKPSFTSTMWSFPSDEGEIKLPVNTDYAFRFNDQSLMTTLAINPNILNIRNDYSIWGERTSVSGANIPIHLRYAIDTIPVEYISISVSDEEVKAYNEKYGTNQTSQESAKYTIEEYDWREIIYRMAQDYYKYNHLSDFEQKVADANQNTCPEGKTGYEQYYTDIYSFWRQIYNADINKELNQISEELEVNNETYNSLQEEINKLESDIKSAKEAAAVAQERLAQLLQPDNSYNLIIELKNIQDEITEIDMWIDAAMRGEIEYTEDELAVAYQQIAMLNSQRGALEDEYRAYETELADVRKTYAEKHKLVLANEDRVAKKTMELETVEEASANLAKQQEYLKTTYDTKNYWAKAVYEQPDSLNFWFDFLNPSADSDIIKYSVKNIGPRPKVVNDSNIKSLYYREVPNVIYEPEWKEESNSTYKIIQVPYMDDMFSISAQGKSAKMRLDELTNTHFYSVETATITSIPLYHLQPNSIVWYEGDYLISKITFSLAYNGTMSITATKLVENIL